MNVRKFLRKASLLALALAATSLVRLPVNAQYINGHQVPDPNFNVTTPAAPVGTLNCAFQYSARNVSVNCPSGQGTINSITYSTTPVIALASGSVQQFKCTTAGASIVPTISGLTAGKEFTMIFVQNGTTACTWTWPSTVHGATAVSATLSSISVQRFVVSANGTDAYAVSAGAVGTTGGTP